MTKHKYADFLIALFLTLATASAFASCDGVGKTIRLGTYKDAAHPNKERAEKQFADTLNKELKGKICLELITDEKRFKGAPSMTALQNGDVEMIAPTFETLGQFASAYRAFELPFAFPDITALERFQKKEGKRFVEAMSKNGVLPLAFWHGEFEQISAKRPVFEPDDLAGLKFRETKSANFKPMMKALKTTSDPVAQNDLLNAVKSGKLGAQLSNWSTLQSNGTAKLAKGVTETNHRFTGYQLMTSKKWWDGQDAATKKQLLEVIGRVSHEANIAAVSRASSAKSALMRDSVAVRTLTQKQRENWKRVLEPVKAQSTIGDDAELLAAVEAANQ